MSTEMPFEKALARLEKIVEELESGNVSLDEALKHYEEGVKLSRACQEKLTQAEKKIEILSRSLNGSFKKEPFNPEEAEKGDAETPAKRKSRASASVEPKKEGVEDADLLF
jgi:exodeoxyribonuclease VII small subunit